MFRIHCHSVKVIAKFGLRPKHPTYATKEFQRNHIPSLVGYQSFPAKDHLDVAHHLLRHHGLGRHFKCYRCLKQSLESNFTSLGANTLTIRNSQGGFFVGNADYRQNPQITYREALRFKERMDYPGQKHPLLTSLQGLPSFHIKM
jgi:hypothetical protein